jgi:hypothetical protein
MGRLKQGWSDFFARGPNSNSKKYRGPLKKFRKISKKINAYFQPKTDKIVV